MNQGIYTIAHNRALTHDIYEMRLIGDTSSITAPGQFLNIKLDGHFLRRPISICDWDEGSITILYKVLGQGTKEMTSFPAGKELDILVGLGNGFSTASCGEKTLLIGGGVGIPPMYGLAKALRREGKKPVAVLGFNTKNDLFYLDEFRALGVEVIVATADGSFGKKGFVTDILPEEYDDFCTCGPLAMLKAVYDATKTGGQFSFEERMGCGFGACMGCSCKTKYGNKRICKDGPVLVKEEIVW